MGSTPHYLAKPYLNPNIHHTHHKCDRPKDKDNWRRDDFQVRVCCVKDHCPLARIGDHPTCCDQFALNYGRTYMPLAVEKYSYLPTSPLRCDGGKIGRQASAHRFIHNYKTLSKIGQVPTKKLKHCKNETLCLQLPIIGLKISSTIPMKAAVRG